MTIDQILDTWSEHVEFQNDAPDKQFNVKFNIEGSPILKREFEKIFKYMKPVKAPDQDNIKTEIISALEQS